MKNLFVLVFILIIACTGSIDKNVETSMQHYDSLILHTDAKGIAEMFTADGEMAPRGMNPKPILNPSQREGLITL